MYSGITRRHFGKALIGTALAAGTSPFVSAAERSPLENPIPSTGERIAAVGLGTSRTFDVGLNSSELSELQPVMQAFFDRGGQLIDSSPMYGRAEQVTGALLKGVPDKQRLFAATKVWTDGREQGIQQMQESMQKMGVATMDLMQIHNLRDWRIHLATLRDWKTQGKIRYIGITTSHGRAHEELADIMRKETLDFVQFSYSLGNREVEKNLFPIAQDRGIATLINRPFQRGDLFKAVRGQALPVWARNIDCESWGQVFLKYVISHPAVTCVIPATSKLKHMLDNMAAGFGAMPDAAMRRTIEKHFSAL